ncbi:MAG: putative photosynthetic complex assembly protein PuhE [Gammaproteobacteria bacterium]
MTLAAMTAVAVIGTIALIVSRTNATPSGAYLAFLGGLSLWAWHEMSYFLGFVTGPRPRGCPPGETRMRQFLYGVQASLWHELAVVVTAAALLWLTAGQPNPIGAWTFMVLWLMRWSAKLNIFLGVRNLHQEFWPEHLRYLGSYVGRRAANALFPLSILAATAGVAWLIGHALSPLGGDFERTGGLLIATLLVLAALEHVFLVIRVPDGLLWRLATEPAGKAATVNVELGAGPGS